MRTLKLILGLGCLAIVPLPGGLAIVGFYQSTIYHDLLLFAAASIAAALAICLVAAGWFLIARRDLLISWQAKGLIALLFCSIAIAAAVVASAFIKGGQISAANYSCINTLRQIDAAAQEFALEKSLKTGDKINFPDDLTPYIKLNKDGKIPPCPQGGVYSLNRVGDVPACSLGTTVTPAHVLP